jgi:hypothetical protein
MKNKNNLLPYPPGAFSSDVKMYLFSGVWSKKFFFFISRMYFVNTQYSIFYQEMRHTESFANVSCLICFRENVSVTAAQDLNEPFTIYRYQLGKLLIAVAVLRSRNRKEPQRDMPPTPAPTAPIRTYRKGRF